MPNEEIIKKVQEVYNATKEKALKDLNNQKTQHEKMNAIENLYSYAKRNVHLNENNYNIKIRARN